HRPRLLYLDEPTANLDVHSAQRVRRLLRELVAEGCTVLLTTHNLEEAEEVCDRVAILCRGRLAALDAPRMLRQRHTGHVADVVLRDGRRHAYDLDRPEGRAALARHVEAGEGASVQTRAFNLGAACSLAEC